MQRVGPNKLTLADIAREAGVTAGALVHRFGSKRALMVALSERVADETPTMFIHLRARHRAPLAVLRAYADGFAKMGETPTALAQNLAYLQQDLTDRDLHRQTAAMGRAARIQIRTLLDEAISAGELRDGTDTDELARTFEITVNGALITWAVHREGTASAWMAGAVDAVLRPYLPARKPKARRRAHR
jgi:AcrR family transcriptional regulator